MTKTHDMKKVLSTLVMMAAALGLVGCKHNSNMLLPNVTGKAGEVVVIMEKSDWDSELGDKTRGLLGDECPWLATIEPLFSLVNVTPGNFSNLFMVHRNILMFSYNSDTTATGMTTRDNVWAKPQKVVQLTASSPAEALKLLDENGSRISATFEQAERDRIIANSILYENHSVAPSVMKVFGGSPHFPTGYNLRKIDDDFAWVAYDTQKTAQGVFVMKYPAGDKENFSVENLEKNIDKLLEAEVPGPLENTWMIISPEVKPTVEFIRYRGRQFAQTRGFWELQDGYYMGGPFVAHSFYSEDGKDIITLFAWVYAPKDDKRLLLRQVESIAYSFEWADTYYTDAKAASAVTAKK